MSVLKVLAPGSRIQRAVVSALFVAASLVATAPDAFAQKTNNRVPKEFTVLPITITGVTVQEGQLLAQGLVGSNPFTAPLTIGAQQTAEACPILDLSLGAIDLNLLGLRVETSPICLEITAYEGGGLLGDLLCDVANLLAGGALLPDVLATLESQGRLTQFLGGLTSLLDQVFDRLTSNNALVGASCTVLNLAIGPLELNLLGLVVELDDCSNGPVTLDITAIPGGGLLGDLLCSLTDLLNGNATAQAINAVLWQISILLGGLVG